MNPLTQFKKIPILPLLIVLTLVAVAPARATSSCALNTVILALEHFPSGSLDLMCNEFDLYGWDLKTMVKGDSDVYIVQNTFPPGSSHRVAHASGSQPGHCQGGRDYRI
jgi:hypothetical protein